jgi:hypothetical protein
MVLIRFKKQTGVKGISNLRICQCEREHTQPRMYSAATMARPNEGSDLLRVEIKTKPSFFARAARDLQKSSGSATCSITCIHPMK